LTENSVVKESLITASDGKNYQSKLYNLDAIISVGYRQHIASPSFGTNSKAGLRERLVWRMIS
jgi:hypothetical protein